MKVSIVIPTLNEGDLLPRLLASIGKQTFRDYEVIVADAKSGDNTKQIATSFGAKVVRGGMPGEGRNAGARRARGEFLFFFDADVVLPADFLEKALTEMEGRFLDLATCEVRPISEFILDRVIHRFMNASIRASVRVDPHALGFAIFVTKRLFDHVGGFDSTIRVGEDSEFVKRAAKLRALGFLDTVHLDVSVRRFEKEGRLKCAKNGIKINLYRMFHGEIRADQIEYTFADYGSKKEFDRRSLLDQLERSILRLEERARETSMARVDSELDRRLTVQLLVEASQRLRTLFLGRGGKKAAS